MIYLPSDLLNNNNTYYLSDNYIVVEENGSCRNVYFRDDYITTDSYVCSSINLPTLSFDKFTDSYFYRLDIASIIFMLFALIGAIILIFNLLFKSLFRRF